MLSTSCHYQNSGCTKFCHEINFLVAVASDLASKVIIIILTIIMVYLFYLIEIPCNGKIWQGLNLATPSSERIGKFLIWRRPLPDCIGIMQQSNVWRF